MFFVWFFRVVKRVCRCLCSVFIAEVDLSLDWWGFCWSVVWGFGCALDPLCFCVPLGSAMVL